MTAVRRSRLVAFPAVIGLAVGLCGCSISDLSFRQDHRLQILAPADRSVVSLPFHVSWELQDRQPAEVHFAVLVDQHPPRPGQTIESLLPADLRDPARCDDACRTAALSARNIVVTDDSVISITKLVRRHGVSDEQRRRHEVTVVVLDAELRRVGEIIAWIEIDEADS